MSMRTRICFATGWFCVVLGVAGIFLPLLPTTPFLLAAAFGFGESSPRFHRWLTGNRYLNSYLENYRSGCGVPRKIKARSLMFLWGTLAVSALLVHEWWYWGLLAAVGVGVSIHLVMLKGSLREPPCFTLVELLVSLGVIAVLAGLVLPSLSRARDGARAIVCASNLRLAGTALEYYADDNAGMIPNVTGPGYSAYSIPIVRMFGGITFALGRVIEQYRIPPEVFGCPLNPDRGPDYVDSQWRGGGVVQTGYIYRETDAGFLPLKAHPRNAGRALVMDFACMSGSGNPLTPHNLESVNVLYNDSHVEKLRNTAAVGDRYTTSTVAGAMTVPACAFIWEHADAE